MTALDKAARAAAEVVRDQKDNALYFDGKAIARAVLMAVRDGSPAVTQAVARAAWHSGSGQNPAVVWSVAVDAILNEAKP